MWECASMWVVCGMSVGGVIHVWGVGWGIKKKGGSRGHYCLGTTVYTWKQ